MSTLEQLAEKLGYNKPANIPVKPDSLDAIAQKMGYGMAERNVSVAEMQDYFKENYMKIAAERVQQAQDRRRQANAPPLTAREQVAIVDAYRIAADEKPYLTGRDFYQESQFAARQGDDFYSRWLANSSAAIQAAVHPSLSVVGTFDPQLANDLQKDTLAQYGPDIQQGTFVGRTVGGVLGYAPAMLPIPAAAPAFFGVTGAGGVRREVAELRSQGKAISTAAEWTTALSTGVINAAIGKLTNMATGQIVKIFANHSRIIAAALQTGGKAAAQKTALQILRNNLPQTLLGAAEGAITLAAMTGLDNAIAKAGYDPERSVLEGVGESAAIGGILTLGKSAVKIARQIETLPTGRIVPEVMKDVAKEELRIQRTAKFPAAELSKADQGLITEIHTALKAAKKVSKVITEEQRAERGQRVAKAAKLTEELAKTETAEKALQKSKAALKEPLTEYDARYESIRGKFKSEQIDGLFKSIKDSPRLRYFEKINTQEALTKLLDGRALQRNEVILLRNQFGSEIASAAMKRRPMFDKVWDSTLDVLGLPRTLLATLDMSGILRQARLLGQAHPREYARMIKDYHKTWVSQKYTDKLNRQMRNSPDYQEAVDMGLQLTRYGKQATSVFEREERFASRFASKIPGVKQSERSYTTALNSMRLAVYSKLRQGMVDSGQPVTDAAMKRVATVINDLSGRSSLGKNIQVRRVAGLLNTLFFAPRFQVSRIKAIIGMASPNPQTRRQASKAMISFIGTNLLAMGLVKLSFGDDVTIELDPRSSEFGKMKFGNFRIDPWAGYVPMVRFIAQMATGQQKDSATNRLQDISRKRVISRFIRGKESPIAGLVTDIYTGKKYSGKELNWTEFNLENEFYQRLTPLSIQDFIDASVNDGLATGLVALPIAWYGMGAQDYKPTEYQNALMLKDSKAQQKYEKDWDELSPIQQKILLRDTEIQAADRAAKASRTSYEYIGEIINQERETGRKVQKKLPDDVKLEFLKTGTTLGSIRKTWGQWTLNDRRYNEYQEMLLTELTNLIRPRIKSPDWGQLPDDNKIKILDALVTRAKQRARNKLLQKVKGE